MLKPKYREGCSKYEIRVVNRKFKWRYRFHLLVNFFDSRLSFFFFSSVMLSMQVDLYMGMAVTAFSFQIMSGYNFGGNFAVLLINVWFAYFLGTNFLMYKRFFKP